MNKNNRNEDSNLEKRIIGFLRKGSFPLEIKASSVLDENGWEVFNQVTYSDPETQKQRTIDVVGRKAKWNEEFEGYIEFNLVIECKKAKNPWLFYTRPFDFKEFRNKDIFQEKVFSRSYTFGKKKFLGFRR